MNKLLLSIIAVIGLITIQGCSTLKSLEQATSYKKGTFVSAEQIKKFTVGKTTLSEVKKELGESQKTGKSKASGFAELEYHYQQINHYSDNVDQKVIFSFDAYNRLLDVRTVAGSQFGNALTGN